MLIFFDCISTRFNPLSLKTCWKKIVTQAIASISHWMKNATKMYFFVCSDTATNTKTSYICISCGCQLQTSQNWKLIYDIPNGHLKEKPTIKLGKIIGVNPNSFKAIKEVLFNLLQQVKSDERTWVRIGLTGCHIE